LLPEAIGCASSYGSARGNQGTVHTVVSRLGSAGVETVAIARGVVLPVDLATSSDGQQMAIAGAGSSVAFWHATGGFSARDIDGQPTAVGYWGAQAIVFSREPAKLMFFNDEALVHSLPLSDQSVFSTGHEIFHKGTPNAIACASCHPEAGEDGHVWTLPEGPRRTPSLRGGLMGTAPFHWTGDQPDVGALLKEVLTRRMGGAKQSPERASALLRWLNAQPALPAPAGVDPSAAERGRLLFAGEAGCESCHTGPQGTNNANANVGTGGVFQVPRLVELGHRAPFFHDGRVATLAERFGALGGGELHGHTSQLSVGQIADLVSYLRAR
jgi:mono/diheme cytochrome c family protein